MSASTKCITLYCSEKLDLGKAIKDRHLHHSGPAIIGAIKATAPYRGGNDGLRAIHDLDVQDKHQALLPIASGAPIPASVLALNGKQNTIPQWKSKIEKDGQMMVMIPEAWAVPTGTIIPAEFQLIFDQGTVFAGRDITQQLDACVIGVENTLNLFERIITDSPSSGSGA